MNAHAPSTEVSRRCTPANVASVPVDPGLARELSTAGKKSDDWRTKRDELVLKAHAQGASLREIAALVGLSNPGVLRIVRKGTSRSPATITEILAEARHEEES